MKRPILRLMTGGGGALLTVIGAAGLPGDVGVWQRWLALVGQDAARWALVIVGLLLVAWAAGLPDRGHANWIQRRESRVTVYAAGRRDRAYLLVSNKGPTAIFRAEVVGYPDAGPVALPLRWVGSRGDVQRVPRGEWKAADLGRVSVRGPAQESGRPHWRLTLPLADGLHHEAFIDPGPLNHRYETHRDFHVKVYDRRRRLIRSVEARLTFIEAEKPPVGHPEVMVNAQVRIIDPTGALSWTSMSM